MEEQQHEEVSEQKQKSSSSTLATIVLSLVLVSALAFVVRSTGLTKKKEKVVASPTPIVESLPSPSPVVAGTSTPSPVVASSSAKQDVNVVTATLEAGSYYYKPNIIRAKKGQTVKVTLNSVSMMHNFVIDELNISMPITKSGSSSTIEFVASKTGSFEFYCSVNNHRKKGQVGTLIVE